MGAIKWSLQGTTLFTARELLDKMLSSDAHKKSKNKIRPAEIERDVHHDLGSFILVLFYSAMKRGFESGVWRQYSDIESIEELHTPCSVAIQSGRSEQDGLP